MNEKLRDQLKGIDAPYPKNLGAQFSRVLDRIAELWDTNRIGAYFTELMIDNPGE
ncbi:MAG: hypothetical protein WA632_15505 [Gallionella sp.]